LFKKKELNGGGFGRQKKKKAAQKSTRLTHETLAFEVRAKDGREKISERSTSTRNSIEIFMELGKTITADRRIVEVIGAVIRVSLCVVGHEY